MFFGFLVIAFIFSFVIPGTKIWQFRKWNAIAIILGLLIVGGPLAGAIPFLLLVFGGIWAIKHWIDN